MTEPAIENLRKPSPWRWLLGVFGDWLIIVAALEVSRKINHLAAYVAAIVIIGTRQHALSILYHDGAHRLICRTRWLNDLMSDLFCGWPLMSSTRAYRKWHFKHHRFLGTPDDSELPSKRTEEPYWDLPASPKRFLFMLMKDLLGITFPRFIIASRRMFPPVSVLDAVGPTLFPILISALLLRLGYGWALLVWYASIATVMPAVFHIRMWTEHVGTNGTHRIHLAPWQQFLIAPHHTWLHWEHHQWPAVPHWNLPKARRSQGSSPDVIGLTALIRYYRSAPRLQSGKTPSTAAAPPESTPIGSGAGRRA